MQPSHVAPQQNRQLIALSAIFVILNILDAQLTLLVVGNGGIELNPIIRTLLTQPAWMFWLFKIGYPLIFVLLFFIFYRTFPQPIIRILNVLVIATTIVCVLNLIGVVL